MGVYEVTNAQYKRVMSKIPSKRKDDDSPVEQMSCQDAMEFCEKLTQLPEERGAGRVYRLPTEAEWEYACRAGTTTKYSFGDVDSQLGYYGWFSGNADEQTHPVGLKKPNGWGLYDMHGNVWEWCNDFYGYYPDGAVTDPQGLLSGSGRVLRGGSCRSSARHGRSAYRSWTVTSGRGSHLGFRLAMSLPGLNPPASKN